MVFHTTYWIVFNQFVELIVFIQANHVARIRASNLLFVELSRLSRTAHLVYNRLPFQNIAEISWFFFYIVFCKYKQLINIQLNILYSSMINIETLKARWDPAAKVDVFQNAHLDH